jgi:L-2,4-diaminobutyrate decarboxylase
MTKEYFDAAPFAYVAEHATARLRDFLTAAPRRAVDGANSWPELDKAALDFLNPSTEHSPTVRAVAGLDQYIDLAKNLHSPNYMGHQVPPPVPLAGVMDFMVGTLNQGLAVSEMSPFASAIERAVVKKFCDKLGWAKGDGFATSGGTLANLTAILCARNFKNPTSWQQGVNRSQRLIVGSDSHYSVDRAMGVLGCGTDQLIKVPVDAHRRLTGEGVAQAIQQVGRDKVFAVVASSPSTPIGAIDELEKIAKVCQENEIWLHVDGVHGLPFLFSEQYKSRLDGIAQADSVSWDAHKMMHVPSLCSFVLFREGKRSLHSFRTQASYLFDDAENAPIEGGLRTFECTKRALSAPLWLVWGTYGDKVFSDIVDHCLRLTQQGYELLSADKELTAPFAPDSNILVFRFADAKGRKSLVRDVRQQLLHEGNFYITQSTIDGEDYFRLTLINPLTELENIAALVKRLKELRDLIA